MNGSHRYDVVIIGAGAAGMMCALTAGQAGKSVLLIDHAKSAGEKIRISGGGRCNFTNMYCGPENFISQNPHFAKSALSRFGAWDFVAMVDAHGIPWHEKTLGQLFCDNSAKDIIAMLRAEMDGAGVTLWLNTSVAKIRHDGDYTMELKDKPPVTCRNLVIASGGKSIPKMGATGFGYDIAKQFGHRIVETRAGLVPLTFSDETKTAFQSISGLSVDAKVTANNVGFHEGLLFTHRGLSGPSILQASSYWREKDPIQVHLSPEVDLFAALREQRASHGKRSIGKALAIILPSRLGELIATRDGLSGNLADHSDKALAEIVHRLTHWELWPTGTEGYRTAEVTLGGVDTAELSSKTLQSTRQPGLFFIGEVVDVTGWLGGFNFQWAWSSGWAAGTALGQQGAK